MVKGNRVEPRGNLPPFEDFLPDLSTYGPRINQHKVDFTHSDGYCHDVVLVIFNL